LPRVCELHPGICLTNEEKHEKNLSYGSSTYITTDTVQYKNNEQYNTQNKNGNTAVQCHRTMQNTEYTTGKTAQQQMATPDEI
jgi:hypothetical protein